MNTFRTLLLSLCCLFLLFACEDKKKSIPIQAQEAPICIEQISLLQNATIVPAQIELSPEAELMTAYLALYTAMADENEANVLQAVSLLSEHAGTNLGPNDWLEIAAWFAERKSNCTLTLLELALKKYPHYTPLVTGYAGELNKNQFTKKAIELLKAELAVDPKDMAILQELGISYYLLSSYPEAIQTLLSLPANARNFRGEYFLAETYLRLNDTEKAIEHLRASIKLNAKLGEAMAELAFLLEEKKEYTEARRLYEKMFDLEFPPNEVCLRLIRLSLLLNQPDKALSYYKKGKENFNDENQKNIAELFQSYDFSLQAECILKDLIKKPNASKALYLLLAELSFEQRRDLNEALKILDCIPLNSPFDQQKMITTALLQSKAKQHALALKTIKETREKYPDALKAIEAEIGILQSTKQTALALELARTSYAKYKTVELGTSLAMLLAETAKKAEASQIMEEILKKDNDNVLALNFVGYSLAEEGKDLERALQLLVRANSLSPNQFFILDSLAWAHFKAGHLEEAWEYIKQANRLDKSNDPTLLDHYGDIANAKGFVLEARSYWRRALEKKMSDEDAAKIKKKLGN